MTVTGLPQSTAGMVGFTPRRSLDQSLLPGGPHNQVLYWLASLRVFFFYLPVASSNRRIMKDDVGV